MKSLLRLFLFFSTRERRSMLMLLLAAIAVLALGYRHLHRTGEERPQPQDSLLQQEYQAFSAHVAAQEKQWKEKRAQAYRQPDKLPEPVRFNPNTADSATFRRLGLPAWMARNILRYREKGGRFRRTEDFRKIYGLTEEQYRQLLPYMDIPPEKAPQLAVRLYNPPADTDSVKRPYKYPAGTVVALNSADITQLKKIPGIGSGIARMIAGYRERLGGFYRIEQLEEIHLDYRRLREWLSIDTTGIRRIDLNTASAQRLHNHPYIDFYQAKAIVEYRRKHGKLKSLKPFVLYEEFSPEDLERIGHYVCFGE